MSPGESITWKLLKATIAEWERYWFNAERAGQQQENCSALHLLALELAHWVYIIAWANYISSFRLLERWVEVHWCFIHFNAIVSCRQQMQKRRKCVASNCPLFFVVSPQLSWSDAPYGFAFGHIYCTYALQLLEEMVTKNTQAQKFGVLLGCTKQMQLLENIHIFQICLSFLVAPKQLEFWQFHQKITEKKSKQKIKADVFDKNLGCSNTKKGISGCH